MNSNGRSRASNDERALQLIRMFDHQDRCLSVEEVAVIEEISHQSVIRRIKRGLLAGGDTFPMRIPVAAFLRYRREQKRDKA